ncbi:MAG: tRNA dihydrouridine(20/20a) synthase DusA [Hyphomicrobiales bacterium]|nr:tRNA dihydrouridine(20/20a) synthase DusA [Hyphomicrobiales bacterium]
MVDSQAETASGKPERHGLDRRFCVAPMMECTDRHCRYFLRLITRHTLLYSEMVTAGALIHGDRDRLLAFDPAEQPLALQLGGSDPRALAQAARIGADFGYGEINLNVGCPSDRVQSGRFGACLMGEPELVADCVAAMQAAVDVPVTVKCRTGIDERDSDEELERFIGVVAAAGCKTFVVHARKAWLTGLSPKQNRDVPPLDYQRVYRLKKSHPELEIVINGGIETLADAERHLAHVDGVMLGRAAYHNPYLLARVDAMIFGETGRAPTRARVVAGFSAYIEDQLARGVRLHQMTRHILGLYNGLPGARAFRRHLSEQASRPEAALPVLQRALKQVEEIDRPSAAAAAK